MNRFLLVLFFSITVVVIALPVVFPTWFKREIADRPFDPNDPRMPPAWRAYMEQVDE